MKCAAMALLAGYRRGSAGAATLGETRRHCRREGSRSLQTILRPPQGHQLSTRFLSVEYSFLPAKYRI